MSDLLNKAAQLFQDELQRASETVLERWRLRVLPTLRKPVEPPAIPRRGEDGELLPGVDNVSE